MKVRTFLHTNKARLPGMISKFAILSVLINYNANSVNTSYYNICKCQELLMSVAGFLTTRIPSLKWKSNVVVAPTRREKKCLKKHAVEKPDFTQHNTENIALEVDNLSVTYEIISRLRTTSTLGFAIQDIGRYWLTDFSAWYSGTQQELDDMTIIYNSTATDRATPVFVRVKYFCSLSILGYRLFTRVPRGISHAGIRIPFTNIN